jgi:hypothetical protein
VTQSLKFDVEREYGMQAKKYGRLARDRPHRVARIGGSNDVATIPGGPVHLQRARVKDKIENKLHDLMCDGKMTLRTVQRGIAKDWQALYKKVYGVAPSG